MSVTVRQLLEASYNQVNVRVEELKRFLDLTKTYSIKTSSHIKIITSLVNELTDSDDTLQLIDTEVAALALNQRYTHTTNINRAGNRSGMDLPPSTPTGHGMNNTGDRRSMFEVEAARSANLNDRPPTTSTHENTRFQPNIEIKNKIGKAGDDNAIAKVLESHRMEFQKVLDGIQQGQNNADFIKSVFEKLLDLVAKQKLEGAPASLKEGRDSMHPPCNCANCLKSLPAPGHGPAVSQSCYVPQNQVKRKPGCLHSTGMDHFCEEESLRSLKDGLDGVREEERRAKKANESGINGMFKQYIELRKEFERVNEDKNRQIADLTRLLEETRSRSELLLREVQDLARQKNVLETDTRDLLTAAKLNADKIGQNFEQRCRNLEREVQRLEGQVDALTTENEGLRRQTKDNERWKNEEDFYKVKLSKLENDYNDLQRNFSDAKNRNGELLTLLEKSNEARTRTKVASETSTIDYNDDLLKCLYSQADYIEAGMNGHFNDSIFKN